MSSVSYLPITSDIRMLKEILLRAGFVSADMAPLAGSDLQRSQEIIRNFRKGVIYPSFNHTGA